MTEGKQRDEMKLYQTFRISYDLNFNSTFNQMSMGEKKKTWSIVSVQKSFSIEFICIRRVSYFKTFISLPIPSTFSFLLKHVWLFLPGHLCKKIFVVCQIMCMYSVPIIVTIFLLYHKTLKLLCSRITQTSFHVLLKNF